VSERTVDVSNPDKLFYPDDGITKGDVVTYYERIAEHMLPWLRNRPLVMERHPDGIDDAGFMQKNAPDHFPDWIRTERVSIENGTTNHVICDDAETLRYLADQACIVFHTFTSLVDRPDRPDQMVFDLDPSDRSDDSVGDVRAAARLLREVLRELEVPSFVKSTGSRGLHVHVPIETTATNDEVTAVAKWIASEMTERAPDEVTTAQRRDTREGRLFIDIMRNHYAQHAVAPYSLRAVRGAPVAVPLDWDEAVASDFDPRRITLGNVFRRLGQRSDPWEGFGHHRVSIRDVVARLDESGLADHADHEVS
jgi:bifunctional non-homologous end joining protein LigD